MQGYPEIELHNTFLFYEACGLLTVVTWSTNGNSVYASFITSATTCSKVLEPAVADLVAQFKWNNSQRRPRGAKQTARLCPNRRASDAGGF